MREVRWVVARRFSPRALVLIIEPLAAPKSSAGSLTLIGDDAGFGAGAGVGIFGLRNPIVNLHG